MVRDVVKKFVAIIDVRIDEHALTVIDDVVGAVGVLSQHDDDRLVLRQDFTRRYRHVGGSALREG